MSHSEYDELVSRLEIILTQQMAQLGEDLGRRIDAQTARIDAQSSLLRSLRDELDRVDARQRSDGVRRRMRADVVDYVQGTSTYSYEDDLVLAPPNSMKNW